MDKKHFIWRELENRLWHTTSLERFRGILSIGAIMPEPNIPDRERYSTSEGARWFPYVRSLGGVSLFDFVHFDLEAYSEKYPVSSWAEFIPFRRSWGCSVWIEICRSKIISNLVSGEALTERWNVDGGGRRVMPSIEAAHIGPLSSTAFVRAFVVREGGDSCEPLTCKLDYPGS